jgi:hypothetical protein
MDNLPEDKNTAIIGGSFLSLLCLYWFWALVFVPSTPDNPPWIFLDYATLIFHEAGHFIFLPFGEFMHVLGGSLNQLLIPAIVLIAFIRQKEGLSAGFALFWLGSSASNLSYYIADARAQQLPLLGGDPDSHDWTWLLTHMNLMSSDTAIGGVLHIIAIVTMIGGLYWMISSVYKKYTGV